MRIVLDINVLISGLLWLGPSHTLLQLAEERKIDICLTCSILEELGHVLDRPKFLKRIRMCESSSKELLSGLLKFTLLFPDRHISPVIKDDPDDDEIIACAEISGAEYIVTGDLHLLKLKQHNNISIITPRRFLTIQKPI